MWFIITLISVFLFALAAVVDKFLLSKSPLVPISYAFIVSLLGGLTSTFLLIFEKSFYFPTEQLLAIIFGGAGFYFALYFLYLAVASSEVSRVNPIINSLTPVIIYFLALVMEIEFISNLKLLGVAVVILGSYSLSRVGFKKTRLTKPTIIFLILTALMLAISHTFSKIAYNGLPFITAFVWLRWLTLLTAMVFTTVASGWSKVTFKADQSIKQQKNPLPALVIGQLSGGGAVILLQLAIKLGSVTIVTALQGLQYFFLLILTIIFSQKYPQILKEDINPKVIKKKILACLILIGGVLLILF